MLALGLLVGCVQKQSVAELDTYINQAVPVLKQHAETTETTNKANRTLLTALSLGNDAETLEALTSYKETLLWALNRVDSELSSFKKLIPPNEARTFHSLMLDGLVKEQYGLTKQLAYYSSVINYGSGDATELNDGNDLLLEAQKIWLQASYELQSLIQKAK
jgi:hypothetical protein